jgi:hypothetical protein
MIFAAASFLAFLAFAFGFLTGFSTAGGAGVAVSAAASS